MPWRILADDVFDRPGSEPATRSKSPAARVKGYPFPQWKLVATMYASATCRRFMTSHFCSGHVGQALLAFISSPVQTSCGLEGACWVR